MPAVRSRAGTSGAGGATYLPAMMLVFRGVVNRVSIADIFEFSAKLRPPHSAFHAKMHFCKKNRNNQNR
jgi:hypothetical protein